MLFEPGIPLADVGRVRSTTMKFLVFLLCTVVAVVDSEDTTVAPTSSPEDLDRADLEALRKALIEAGGPGGTLENIKKDLQREPETYRDHGNCSFWDYDNTTIYTNGRFRHELAVLHTEDEPHEVRFGGFLGDRFAPKPFVITYFGGYGNEILSKTDDKCSLLPSGVLACSLCVKTHFIFHDRPEIGCKDVPQEVLEPEILLNGDILERRVGLPEKPSVPHGGNVELAKINILPLLERFGGAPGKVTANRRKPASNADNSGDSVDQWLYDYRFTDVSKAIRFEHAVLRSAGTPQQHEDIFGTIYWRSHSGDLYINYQLNSTGLHAKPEWAKIKVYRSLWTMNYPPDLLCKVLNRPGLVAQLLSQPH